MNQENNFNTQGYNGVSNNQPLNTNKIIRYDSQTGQPIYANQNQTQQNLNNQPMNNQNNNQIINPATQQFQQPIQTQFNSTINNNFNQQNVMPQQIQKSKPKKKLKWWIPVLFFVGGFLMSLGNSVASIIVKSQEDLVLESDLLKNPIIMSFRWLAIICWLMVIPSLIIVIVKYNKKTPDEKKQNDFQINNMINSASSLDEKLLIAYIGNNYEKIIQKKFSVPALFFSWIYTLYRKVYIPSIIGMLTITILGFLPSAIYSILVLAFLIILGINFNKWYISYAKKQVEKIKNNNQNINEIELINICRKKGGTNIWLAIVIYIVFAIISNYI